MKFSHLLAVVASLVLPCSGEIPRWEAVLKPWDRSLGSHRVVVKVEAVAEAVIAGIPWRRRDVTPEKKAVLVWDLKSGKEIANVRVTANTAEAGEIVFQPVSGAGEYAVYFLPVKIDGGAFPVSRYRAPEDKADAKWKGIAPTADAKVARWEALTANDAWNEMEVIATAEEAARVAAVASDGMRVAFVPAELSVRMFDRLPAAFAEEKRWAQRGAVAVKPGGVAVWQVLVWAAGRDLNNVRATTAGALAPVCLSTDGVDWNGKPFSRRVDVAKGRVLPLWFSVEVPADARDGDVPLELAVTADGVPAQKTGVILRVGKNAPGAEDRDPASLTRLRWLNSKTAVDDEPAKGYAPLELRGSVIRCLGREVELAANGLPARITSFFRQSLTEIAAEPQRELLRAPMRMIVETDAGDVELRGAKMEFTRTLPGVIEWRTQWSGAGLAADVTGRMEFDGSLRFGVAMSAADKAVAVKNVRLEIARTPESCRTILGLQHETGIAPPKWEWKWDVANKNQDSVWLGAVNGGLRVQLKAENYVRPSVNIHYHRRPLNDPPSWSGGTGGMRFAENTLVCFSGARTLERDTALHFDFDLLVTPFHALRTAEQWIERYFHTSGVPRDTARYLDGAKTAGANIVNIHQGNWLNPYINYPFVTWEKLRDFSSAAHERGMRAKFYYTVRELSNWAPEIFALRSMGDEVLLAGKGGGHPWGEEHLGGDYWQAWHDSGVQDVSFLTQPMSRWHNYYVEGLRWLCENAGCDGIYLDDIAYDRAIMLRARKVLDRHSPRGGRIDLHSWNEFHGGGAWAQCANIFMDSLPFVDRIWFGEGHHYNGHSAENFLVGISGIPFGVMGEMLEGGGNPWFGLLHGATGRLGWQGDPRPAWRLWDAFGVGDAQFIGWWAGDECPVRSSDPDVKVTVWRKADATLVAMANFAKEPRQAALTFDWKRLGRDPAKARLYAPPIPEWKQRESLDAVTKPVALRAFSGAVFILDEKERTITAAPAAEALGAVIHDDAFAKLDPAWKLVASPKAKDGTRLDAGFVFVVPANVHAFLERELPPEARAVSARVWQDPKDEGQQWGPGFALEWPGGKTLKVSVRKDGQLSVAANGNDVFPSQITTRAPVEFSIRWDDKHVRAFAGGPAMGDLADEIASFPRAQFPGQPRLLRVGKMPSSARPGDHGDPGPPGFTRIEWLRIHR